MHIARKAAPVSLSRSEVGFRGVPKRGQPFQAPAARVPVWMKHSRAIVMDTVEPSITRRGTKSRQVIEHTGGTARICDPSLVSDLLGTRLGPGEPPRYTPTSVALQEENIQ
jgi:hypothetical protein